MKYYVDAGGNYIGGFQDVVPPDGAIEVSHAPGHAFQKWDGAKWLPLPPMAAPLTMVEIVAILTTKGIITPADIVALRK